MESKQFLRSDARCVKQLLTETLAIPLSPRWMFTKRRAKSRRAFVSEASCQVTMTGFGVSTPATSKSSWTLAG